MTREEEVGITKCIYDGVEPKSVWTELCRWSGSAQVDHYVDCVMQTHTLLQVAGFTMHNSCNKNVAVVWLVLL